MSRIGVFICHCGSNISATVDVEKVKQELEKENHVVFATTELYMCSENSQKLIKEKIKELNLTGILICSCSPRMHEETFKSTIQEAGLNPYMLEIANIREQCSWVHKDKLIATEKAILLAKTALTKLLLNKPLYPIEMPLTRRALVIGGGIAGIQTALDLAQANIEVDIVETMQSIGGKMAQLDKTFPTLDCSACILTPKMVECAKNPLINIYSYSDIENVKGFVGNFDVTIKHKARFVDSSKCIGCGLCLTKCPVKNCPDDFNMNLSKTSAINIPFSQAVPYIPSINKEYCLKLSQNKCGLCSKICPTNAIDYHQEDSFSTKKYGAIILATGYEISSPENFSEFGYKDNKDVITSMELERIMSSNGPTNGKLLKPSDNTKPKDITFIQCVGSRNITPCGKPYCSKVCCLYTAKHAMMIKEKYPDISVRVFYIDVRTPGKNYDEFYRRAVEKYNVEYIKGMVGKVYKESDKLKIMASDLILNEQLNISTDLVVLAQSIEPSKTAKKLASMLSISIDNFNFFNEAHPKLKPVESATNGIFLAGMCSSPKDIPETVLSASACASKVIGLFSKNSILSNPCTANVDEKLCSGCGQCSNVCPYNAIEIIEKPLKNNIFRKVSSINQALCQGCGCCVSTCPSSAVDLNGFSSLQLMKEVETICKK